MLSHLQIVKPSKSEEYNQVRKLIQAFVQWHRRRHTQDLTLIDNYFYQKDFEQELASLPEKYTKGRNSLLLAKFGHQPAGCVALREIDANSCEMKRMFVYEEYHGIGVGRALAKAIIQQAKELHYTTMKLDTSIRQIEAQKLYESLGFYRSEPYYKLPKTLQNWLVFMELDLK